MTRSSPSSGSPASSTRATGHAAQRPSASIRLAGVQLGTGLAHHRARSRPNSRSAAGLTRVTRRSASNTRTASDAFWMMADSSSPLELERLAQLRRAQRPRQLMTHQRQEAASAGIDAIRAAGRQRQQSDLLQLDDDPWLGPRLRVPATMPARSAAAVGIGSTPARATSRSSVSGWSGQPDPAARGVADVDQLVEHRLRHGGGARMRRQQLAQLVVAEDRVGRALRLAEDPLMLGVERLARVAAGRRVIGRPPPVPPGPGPGGSRRRHPGRDDRASDRRGAWRALAARRAAACCACRFARPIWPGATAIGIGSPARRSRRQGIGRRRQRVEDRLVADAAASPPREAVGRGARQDRKLGDAEAVHRPSGEAGLDERRAVQRARSSTDAA